MIYTYDKAICEDLQASFSGASCPVKVVDPESAIDVVAQIQNDKIPLPLVVLTRTSESGSVDTNRANFTMMHKGVATVINNETNDVYCEKAIPILLGYDLTVLATNTADMDEMMREIMFKYASMYFLSIKVPYESKRRIRFGIGIRPDTTIEQSSGQLEYLENGKLYQKIIHLVCEGCVLLSYTPVKLHRNSLDASIELQRRPKAAKSNSRKGV